MGIGMAILSSFMMLWVSNNPDVIKQAISSGEKVAVRLIDESSEIIDKTGEAFEDIVSSMLPDLWGLGWK